VCVCVCVCARGCVRHGCLLLTPLAINLGLASQYHLVLPPLCAVNYYSEPVVSWFLQPACDHHQTMTDM